MAAFVFREVRQVAVSQQRLEIIQNQLEFGEGPLGLAAQHEVDDLQRTGIGENARAARGRFDRLPLLFSTATRRSTRPLLLGGG